MYLCNECDKEYPEINFDFENTFSIKYIFSRFVFKSKQEIENKLICPKCKRTYMELKKVENLGVVSDMKLLIVK